MCQVSVFGDKVAGVDFAQRAYRLGAGLTYQFGLGGKSCIAAGEPQGRVRDSGAQKIGIAVLWIANNLIVQK